MPDAPQRSSGLSAKVGGVPMWGLLAGGVGVGALWFLSKRSKANQAAAQPSAVTSPVSTGQIVPGQGSLQPILLNLGQSSSTSKATTGIPAGLTMQGSGYWGGPANPFQSTPSGSTYGWVSSQQQLDALKGSGSPLFWQSQPGQFTPVPAATPGNPTGGLAAGTPLFTQVS